ncbi:MAG: aminodeoxychorismate/anthranilate synthase component II [Proteobacteria bacterium]|nr:aminodeoxychorismate/anthranilate synthase component II [Pseudomonadota bacterium]
MVLMIDNYDSFTYNLVQYFGELGQEVRVERNDAIGLDDIRELAPEFIIISPGPCSPDQAGISMAVVRELCGEFPILGVCLGHQSIAQAFGGRVVHAKRVMHGKTSLIHHHGTSVFRNLENPFTATRYHSLVAERASLPECLEITAWTEDEHGGFDEIMGLMHKTLPVHGVQFHPESILTDHGHQLLANFFALGRAQA